MKPFLALTLGLLVACSSNETRSGGNYTNDQETCSETGSCVCKKDCSHTCTSAEPCTYQCDEGATCTFSCPQGRCTIGGAGNITVDCAGGKCVLACTGDTCVMKSCTNGCTVGCNGATTCTSSCKDSEQGCATVP